MNDRERFAKMTREITYSKVLLAVYTLAESSGKEAVATNHEICRASGRGLLAVRWALAEMERRGVITKYMVGRSSGLPSGRVLVLMDDPGAVDVCETWQSLMDLLADPVYAKARRIPPKRSQVQLPCSEPRACSA